MGRIGNTFRKKCVWISHNQKYLKFSFKTLYNYLYGVFSFTNNLYFSLIFNIIQKKINLERIMYG